MALDFDPIYHTETMVKILREQGSTLHAMELAEKILEREPENQSVRQILQELKAEARASFERFRKAGNTEKGAAREESELIQEGEVVELERVSEKKSEPEAEIEALSPSVEKPDPRIRKIQVLEGLLTRVQNYRRQHG